VSNMWAIRFPHHLERVNEKSIKEIKPKIKLKRLIDPIPEPLIEKSDEGLKILEQVLEEVKVMPVEEYEELQQAAEVLEPIKIMDLDVFREDVVGTVVEETISTGLKLFQEDLKAILNDMKNDGVNDGVNKPKFTEKWIEELAIEFTKNSK
jgi:hypothetical protein